MNSSAQLAFQQAQVLEHGEGHGRDASGFKPRCEADRGRRLHESAAGWLVVWSRIGGLVDGGEVFQLPSVVQ